MYKLKRTIRLVSLLAVATLLLFSTAQAQPEIHKILNSTYDISWWTVDAGGISLSNGNYFLNDTVGQPDAAIAVNGSYNLISGFLVITRTVYHVFLPVTLKH